MSSPKLLFTTLAALALAAPAHAAFNANGIETFNGSSLDLTNWEVFSWQPVTAITQNNAITISCLDLVQPTSTNYADYTTLLQTVAVGQSVSVDVTVNQYSDAGSHFVALYLTNNSLGTTRTSNVDSYKSFIWNDPSLNVIRAGYGDATQWWRLNWIPQAQTPGTTLRYVIERTTDSSATYALFDSANNSLGSKTVSIVGDKYHPIAAYPDPLFISLYVQGASVTFDNVTVFSTPEPASLALLAPALLLLKRRRR